VLGRRVIRIVAGVLTLAALASSCANRSSAGTGSAPAGSDSAAAFPLHLTSAAGPAVLASRPTRIVSLSPTATEMLFAVGAGPQVVAVDDQSNYPPTAPMTKLSGFEPNVEAIAAYRPDLVVIAEDPGGLVRSLRSLRIPVLSEPTAATLGESYRQIAQLGVATGHVAAAAALVSSMRSQIEAVVRGMPHVATPPSIYHELDDTDYSATSKTFIGQLYAMLGVRNIADRASGAASGYPQLSAEYIIAANPDLIFLADVECCHQSLSTVAARPGWGAIAAVRHGDVIALDGDVASRWGPRIVQFVREIAAAIRSAEARKA
jgi:iron complex transport system substrate-binding protein